jgi:type IV secretion system protein VirB4
MKSYFADLLPYAGFADDGIIITKEGVLLRTYYVVAQDFAFADNAVLLSSLRNLINLTALLSYEGWSLQLDAHRVLMDESSIYKYYDASAPTTTKIFENRRNKLTPIFQTKFFLTICKEVSEEKASITQYYFSKATGSKNKTLKSDKSEIDSILLNSLEQDLYEYKSTTQDFYNSMTSTFESVHALDNDELLTYLHSTFSDTTGVIKSPENLFYIDNYLSDGLFIGDSISRYNDDYIMTCGIHDLPSESMAHMIYKVMTLPITFRLSTRFIFIDREKAKKNIKSIRLGHFKRRKGVGALFEEATLKTETQLEDTEALALTNDSANALAELASSRVSYGHITTVAIVRDKDSFICQKKLDVLKAALFEEGIISKTETINTASAFLASIPGNIFYDQRRITVSTNNLIHFFPISSSWHGSMVNLHLKSVYEKLGYLVTAPHVLCKTAHTNEVYYLNLAYRGVGHTLVLGPTGSGKSIALNTLAIFFLKYPKSKVIFFDIDKSSKYACSNSGGQFIDINDNPESIKLNPFSNIDDPEEQTFVTQLILDFLDSREIKKTITMENEIYSALREMASDSEETWGFETFKNHIQDKNIRAAMEIFISGDYKTLFKSGRNNNISFSRWTTFELRWLLEKSKYLCEFVLNYLFHIVDKSFELNGYPAELILDEAWLPLSNPRFSKRIEDWLRTLRKKNVYVILATQNIDDCYKSDIFSTLINNCFTKILLPNPKASEKVNIELYGSMGLSVDDISAVVDAEPQKQYLFVNPDGKQLFEFCLGKEEIQILTRPCIFECNSIKESIDPNVKIFNYEDALREQRKEILHNALTVINK